MLIDLISHQPLLAALAVHQNLHLALAAIQKELDLVAHLIFQVA
jgi:hypothetical protein